MTSAKLLKSVKKVLAVLLVFLLSASVLQAAFASSDEILSEIPSESIEETTTETSSAEESDPAFRRYGNCPCFEYIDCPYHEYENCPNQEYEECPNHVHKECPYHVHEKFCRYSENGKCPCNEYKECPYHEYEDCRYHEYEDCPDHEHVNCPYHPHRETNCKYYEPDGYADDPFKKAVSVFLGFFYSIFDTDFSVLESVFTAIYDFFFGIFNGGSKTANIHA